MRGAKDKRMGSPPHVRGKGCNLARGVRPNRITPACAGKRQRLGLCPLKGSGSPPHVRGKVSRIAIGKQTHRITPAYAGKRNDRHQQQAQEKDHPRVCGEKTALLRPPQTTTGSPPRMRGKVHHGVSVHALKRITPAYAGKRGHKVRLQAAGRDHPRVCGEKAVIHLKVRFFTGSPPRMRGKDVPWSFNQGLGGITPAYAGKSAFGLLSSAESGDHPRVCGEK